MLIRKATLNDLDAIVELAESVKISPQRPLEKGFLTYVLSRDRYAFRIVTADFFYVADNSSRVIGYLMSYGNEVVEQLKTTELSHEKGVLDFVSTYERYILGDQIVSTGNSGKHLVHQMLIDANKKDYKQVFHPISHTPINSRSIRFNEKLGFSLSKEVVNPDEIVWGIYEKKLR